MKNLLMILAMAFMFTVGTQEMSAQTRTNLTWGTLATAYQLNGSTGGIKEKSTATYVYTNGAQVSDQTISNGEQLVFDMPTATANWLIGLSSSHTVSPNYIYSEDIASPYTNTTIPYAVFIGIGGSNVQTQEPAGFQGSPSAVSSGNYIRINYSGGIIVYQKSSDAVTWTTFFSSAATPSGSYYVVFQGLSPNYGPSTVYKVGTASQAPPTVSVAPISQSVILPTSSTLIVGSASSAGRIASKTWTKVSGPAGSALSSTNTDSTIVSGMTQGTFVYRYTATDTLSQSSTADATITVNSGSTGSSNVTYTLIPATDPEIMNPERGAYEWQNQNAVGIPTAAAPAQMMDAYYRNHTWYALEPTQNNYNWALFDAEIKAAIDKGQGFGFGIMTLYPGAPDGGTVAGKGIQYPPYLHTLMQGETVKDWIDNTNANWVPNWNSPNWISRWGALHRAIKNHLDTSVYKGIRFRDVIDNIETRGYGMWGEWHMCCTDVDGNVGAYPTGTKATAASLISIMDSVALVYDKQQVVFMLSTMDCNLLGNTLTDPAVAYHALTVRNGRGLLGWRRDNWGWTDSYISSYIENNKNVVSGLRMDTAMLNRYLYAPITGETGGDANDLSDLVRQTNLYHQSAMGNGNYPGNPTATQQANFRAASKIMGYRLQIESANIPTTATAGASFTTTLNWRNAGLAPVYRKWYAVFELRSLTGTVMFRDTSSFKPAYFAPSTAASSFTDTRTWPSTIQNGTYTLNMIVRDSTGYRKPLALANIGRATDGSYLLQTITFGGAVNQPPVVSIASGIPATIVIPTDSARLSATATDADGTIASYTWTQISGPATATIVSSSAASTRVTGLSAAAGQYTFRITVADNVGATATSTVSITVLSVSLSAGPTQTITLPTNSAVLTATQSNLLTPTWTQVSGPNTAVFTSATNISTQVTGLIAGTYTFRITMYSGSTPYTSDVVITVVQPHINVPPTVNAGFDQTIQYPAQTSVTLSAVGTDPDGFVASYQWIRISGPNTPTIATPTQATTLVTGLTTGTYKFSVIAVDNAGATSAPDTVQVQVNATVNQAPVSNAGPNQTITTSSTTLSGSGTDADGTVVSYLWAKVSGPAATISSSSSASTTVTGLVPGTYVFSLTVTDNLGATGVSTITVTVTTSSTTYKYIKSATYTTITTTNPPHRKVTIVYTDNSVETIEYNSGGAYIIIVRQGYQFIDGFRRLVVYLRFSDGTTRLISKTAI